MDPGNQGSVRCVLLTHPGGPGGRAGAAGPTSRVGGSSGGRAGGERWDDADERAQACLPASAFASFVLPSLLPNFLPGLSALLLLASFSLGGGGGVRVRGWHAVSFILRDLFWPTASRAYLPLAPSRLRSFLLPIESPQACQPARVRAGAGQWQRYHVTSTPPPPHLKKANCIERHRCHRRPPPIARLFRRSFFRFASFSLATLDECTFHWRHGGRGRAGGRPDAAAEVESVARAAAEAASELPYFHQAKLPTAGRTRRLREREGGRKLNCRITTRCAINDDSNVGPTRAPAPCCSGRNEKE